MNQIVHKPVLLKEVLGYLDIRPNDLVVDATFGFGGHSSEIAKKLRYGKIIGIEKDEEVAKAVEKNIDRTKITLVNDDFGNIAKILEKKKITRVDKILFDLGISSYHFDQSGRGFTFKKDEPLDMRLGKSGTSAADLVNGLSKDELANMFYTLADERFSRQIATAILERRKKQKFEKTADLARVIESVKKRFGKIHPATQVFQALRIAINSELELIKKTLPEAIDLLKENGRIAVISFHSGEDRIVKNIFKEFAQNQKIEILNKKTITASFEEIKENPRSRSAKLRVAKRRK